MSVLGRMSVWSVTPYEGVLRVLGCWVRCRDLYPQTSTTSRYVALVAILTALYSVWGYTSGIAFRSVTRSLDLFFLLPAFFGILVSLTGRRWSSTLLGTIIGLLFLYPTAGVPASPHITVSLIASGFVFDLYLRESKASLYELSRRQLVAAGLVGNLAMAVVGLLVFQFFGGFFQIQGGPPTVFTWALALVGDPIAGAFGGLFGWIVIERVKGVRTRRLLEARSPVKVRV